MNLIHNVPSVGCSNTGAPQPGDTRIQDQSLIESRRDRLVVNELLFISLSGLPAVVAAICTTLIERGRVWRHSWLAACIVLAVLTAAGIFKVGSTIGLHTPQPRTVLDQRS